jgi:hypothetical protein
MSTALTEARADGSIYRVSRAPDAWAWPPWSYAGEDGTFGNRFDDPQSEYRVLYASSPRVGAFIETLARYRTDPAIVAAYEEITVDPEDQEARPTIPPGIVPVGWRAGRRIGSAMHDGPLADIGHLSSLATLRVALAGRLVHYRLDDLDAGDLRRRVPRSLTQEVSRCVFEHGSRLAVEHMVGVHYLSRLSDEIENWAVFEGSDPH